MPTDDAISRLNDRFQKAPNPFDAAVILAGVGTGPLMGLMDLNHLGNDEPASRAHMTRALLEDRFGPADGPETLQLVQYGVPGEGTVIRAVRTTADRAQDIEDGPPNLWTCMGTVRVMAEHEAWQEAFNADSADSDQRIDALLAAETPRAPGPRC